MKNVFILATAVAAIIAVAPVKQASAQVFAGIGAGLGAALGHGEEESSIGQGQPPRDVSLSEHRRTHNTCKARSHPVKAAPAAHIHD